MTKTEHNENGHWQVCAECGFAAAPESHSFTNGRCACGENAPVEVTEPVAPSEPYEPTTGPADILVPIIIVSLLAVAAAIVLVLMVLRKRIR